MGRFPSPRYPRALQFSLPNWTGLAGRDVGIRKISLKLAEMADAEQSIPDIYREAAEEVRQLARRARLTDIRSDLLELSARFERLAAIDRAILRLAIHELRATDTPPKVVLNEAVELAKKFSSEESGSFVNGILDAFRKTMAAP